MTDSAIPTPTFNGRWFRTWMVKPYVSPDGRRVDYWVEQRAGDYDRFYICEDVKVYDGCWETTKRILEAEFDNFWDAYNYARSLIPN